MYELLAQNAGAWIPTVPYLIETGADQAALEAKAALMREHDKASGRYSMVYWVQKVIISSP